MEKPFHILIADRRGGSIETVLRGLKRDDSFRVTGVTGSGVRAFEIVRAERPDILLSDIALDEIDGLSLIRRLRTLPFFLRPVSVLTGCGPDPETEKAACAAGVNYCLHNYFQLQHIVLVLRHIVAECFRPATTVKPVQMTPEVIVDRMLTDMGVPPHSHAFDYIATSILLAVEKGDRDVCVFKDIYPVVGLRHGASGTAVERLIRYTISNIWVLEHDEAFLKYLDMTTDERSKRPTNSEFILSAAKYVIETLGKPDPKGE